MVTYEAMDRLFQFGIFLATIPIAIVAVFGLVTKKKKK